MQEVLWAAERPAYRLKVLRGADRAASLLESTSGVGSVAVEGSEVRFHCDGGAEVAAAALAAITGAGVPVARLSEEESRLESTFLRLAREDGNGAAKENSK